MSALTWMAVLLAGLRLTQATQEPTQPEPASPPDIGSERTPRLVVESSSVELGTVREGQVYEISFQLTNAGNAELRIEKVLSSCACTVARLESAKLAPAQAVTLFATFDTTDLNGRKLESIEVLSNDPANPRTVLSIDAHIERMFTLEPSHVRLPNGLGFQSEQRGRALPVVRLLAGKPGQPLELGAIRLDVPGIDCRHRAVVENGVHGHELTFSLADTVAVGMLRATAHIPVSVAGEQRTIKFPIHGEVVSNILFTPAMVPPLTSTLPGADLAYGRITLRAAASNKPFKIREVRCGTQLTSRVDELIDGREYHVTLAASKQARPGPCAQTVIIVTDSPEQPTIRIPVYAQIAALVVTSPANVYLYRDANGQHTTESITLIARAGTTPTIENATIENPHFTVIKAENSVTVELAAAAPPGRHEALVTVYTNVPTARELVVPVIADIR